MEEAARVAALEGSRQEEAELVTAREASRRDF